MPAELVFLLYGGVGYFIFSVFFFVTLGILLNFTNIKAILTKPIGLGIGIFCNFLLLPLLGYALGWALFVDDSETKFGLLLVAISTTGVASICWTVLLNGNIDLAITINVINTGLAYVSIPLWILTQGRNIFITNQAEIPLGYLTFEVILLVFSYGLGILIGKNFCSDVQCAMYLVESFAVTYLIATLSMGIYNSYELFWQLSLTLKLEILLAGFVLPTFGYLITWLIATVFKLDHKDRITIALGAFNVAGIMSSALYYAMIHPYVYVVWVLYTAIIVMTPFPLAVHYLVYKIKERFSK